MKIGIHKNNGGFSEHWIKYCEEKKINYKLVDCYSNSIVRDLWDCNIVMWHPLQMDYKAELFFKQFMYSLQNAGKNVFPDFNTVWHFDDKVGQKYLLEAIDVPFVNTYVFYDKKEAIGWANSTEFPKVFKLRGGAGSDNVRLAKNRNEAIRLINKAFSRGFSQYNRIGSLVERLRKFRNGKTTFDNVLKGFYRLFFPTMHSKIVGRERGYIYFQDFIPNNNFDIRVCVIGDKAFAIKRLTRENDFRASGSGNIIYDKNQIDESCVRLAFEVNKKINAQSIAFDFVFNRENKPLIIEISYGYRPSGYYDCPGYWNNRLQWHEGEFNPYGWMVDNIIRSSIAKTADKNN